MSEGKLQNDILNYVSQLSFPLNEKAFEIQTIRGDEEESNPGLADDALDDSSSSYCTALCSLSEYSEALEDETPTDPPCENALSESSQFVSVSGHTLKNSSSENNDPLQDCKTKHKDCKVTSLDASSKCYVKNPIYIESKKFLLSPKITILNVNLININSVDADQDSTPTSKADPIPWDYLKNKKDAAQTYTKPVQSVGSLEYKITPDTILTKNKYTQEWNQKYNDIKPEEHPESRNACYKPSTEFKLDSGESIVSKMKWEGKQQSIGVGKEQADLSVTTGNRKPPASCTSILTGNKQQLGILPRCYSKRLLATRNQHQSQSPPVSRRLKRQNGQGAVLSASLPPTSFSTSRPRCSSEDITQGKFSMATKVAGTSMDVSGLAALEYTRSSLPTVEADNMDAFNSTCWSSTQLPSDRDFNDWSKDALSFKMAMISTNNINTSACSEASSFECIDVALENHEEVDRNTKTVPKRQIQLKRRDKAETHDSEKDITKSTRSRPRDTLQRQHSTPAAFHQDSHRSETKPGKTVQKQRLQKSLSLDETSSKTKMASCIIKNVLSKRMQHEQILQSEDIPDQTFCSIKADDTVNTIDYLTSCAKEECIGSIKGNLATVPLLSTSSQSPPLMTDSQTMSSIKEHVSVSSKILPKLISKHGFNPLLGGLGRTQFQGSGTEIAAYSETEKEKPSPSKEANQGSGENLSCDSAKGKAWNLSAVTSEAVGKQATVKTPPKECVNVQGAQKQHHVKDQPIEKQEKPGERKKTAQSPTVSCSIESNTVDNVLSQTVQCNLEKGDQESGKGELRPPGQSVNMGIQGQGKFRAIAPVHVVRDMRSLVKNTYSLSFRGPSEAIQGQNDTVPNFTTAAPHRVISKRENNVKGHKKNEKVLKATCRVTDLTITDTTSNECATKVKSILESNNKIPYTGCTKISPISTAQTNSCRLSKSPDANDSVTPTNQTNIQCSHTYIKQITNTVQAHMGTLTNTSKNEKSTDSWNPECEKPKALAVHSVQPLANESKYCLPEESFDQLSNIVDDHQAPDLPAQSQSSAGTPSACILTVAPTQVFPSYFYKPNLLGYQTISQNMGTVSYVQGPVLLQRQPHKPAATASGSVPLTKSLSVEEILLSQPCSADGHPVIQESSKQMDNGDTSQKMPSPDIQSCAAFFTNLGAEGRHGSACIMYPEVGGSQHMSNSQHVLLDPETGQCFYVDLPQLPQRKMLFDPETCQYVEVVVPQQTLSSTVMTTPCAIPFPSLHIPAMYTPQCLSYVQTHHRVLPPPEP